jgi:hypothetical protein
VGQSNRLISEILSCKYTLLSCQIKSHGMSKILEFNNKISPPNTRILRRFWKYKFEIQPVVVLPRLGSEPLKGGMHRSSPWNQPRREPSQN